MSAIGYYIDQAFMFLVLYILPFAPILLLPWHECLGRPQQPEQAPEPRQQQPVHRAEPPVQEPPAQEPPAQQQRVSQPPTAERRPVPVQPALANARMANPEVQQEPPLPRMIHPPARRGSDTAEPPKHRPANKGKGRRTANPDSSTYKGRDADHRREYQRLLMRQRRAEKREAAAAAAQVDLAA